MEDELTTAMHAELLDGEINSFDLRVMAVFGAIRRGKDKQTALRENKITEAEYNANIDRVLES